MAIENVSNNERFSRIELMLGKDACERLRNSFVVVIGLGAVGTYAVEGLARSGIGKMRLIDFDCVCPSNINRQLYALTSTIGRPKCEVARERVLDINPECKVEAINGFVDDETVGEFVAGGPNLVIDAIDSLGPKIGLLAAVRTRGLPVISCLGAALRTDPTRIRIGTLDDVHTCPLGKEVRKRLRKRGIELDFPCVYSDEPLPNPLPIAAPSEKLGEEPIFQRGRVRNTLGSLPTLTGMFGLVAANHAISLLAGHQGPNSRSAF